MRTPTLAALSLALVACSQGPGIRPLDAPPPGPAAPPEPPDLEILDRTVQVPTPEVDVLFVIDDSCSMDAEQQDLAANFPRFMDYVLSSGTDFHIGVVSTSTDTPLAGLLEQVGDVGFIDPDTPAPSAVFSAMATLGTGGSADEAGRAAAWQALELRRDAPRNAGFRRDEAHLHLIFLSDEDDQSGSDPITLPEFLGWMDTLGEDPEAVVAHALVWPPGQPCPDGTEVGHAYAQYVAHTGGVLGNICAPVWTPFLDALGLATAGLRQEFFLSHPPAIDPLDLDVQVHADDGEHVVTRRFDVCMAGEGCEVEYLPGRNSVAFTDYLPAPLEVVEIRYRAR